jgi:hypothetical protein
VLAFGLAGLGCSALLPLTIGFAQEELAAVAAAAAGGIIAFYQLGYGIAAFGVGPLLDAGVSLPAVYAAAAGIASPWGCCPPGWSAAGSRSHTELSPFGDYLPLRQQVRYISGREGQQRARLAARKGPIWPGKAEATVRSAQTFS